QLGVDLLFDPQPQRSLDVGAQDLGVYVTFSADRWGIPEPCGDVINSLSDVLLGSSLGIELLELKQGKGGKHGPVPGAEIFRGNIFVADVPQVGIDIRRCDVACLASIVEVLEELLPRQVLAGANDFSEAPIADTQTPILAALTLEVEAQLG